MTRVALIALLLAAGSVARADSRINAFLEPDGPVYLGQQVRLIVEIETDTWFTTAPRYPEIEVPGAVVLQPEAFAVNSTRREGPVTWTGQRQRYAIFPQRTGVLAVPGIDVSFAVSTEGRPDRATALTTPPLAAEVRLPPGAEAPDSFVTTPRLDVREAWTGELEGLEVGDAVIRTVIQTGADTFALLLPAVSFEAPQGVATYAATPKLEDRADRGTYRATRTDAVTYVLEKAGTVELPSIDIHWFDIDASTMRTETLGARSFEVAVNPSLTTGPAATPELRERLNVDLGRLLAWLQDNLIWLTSLAAAVWLLREVWIRFGGRARAWLERRREDRRQGERAYYRRAMTAARHADGDAFVAAFWAWSDRLPGRAAPLRSAALVKRAGLIDDAAWREFEAGRYGSPGARSPLPLRTRAQLRRLRSAWLAGSSRSGRDAAPTLNP